MQAQIISTITATKAPNAVLTLSVILVSPAFVIHAKQLQTLVRQTIQSVIHEFSSLNLTFSGPPNHV